MIIWQIISILGVQTRPREVERCFEKHKQFAEKTKKILENAIDEINRVEDKLERLDYMEKSDDEFEYEGVSDPTSSIEKELSQYVNKQIEGSDDENPDSIETMDINQLAYFIGEDLRKKLDKEYDMSLYNNIYNAYPEQSEIISNKLSNYITHNENNIEDILRDISNDEHIPPLNSRTIEEYIIPRVFYDNAAKTPAEIGMI